MSAAGIRVGPFSPTGSPLRTKKTFKRVAQHFYWPTMYKDIAEYCRSCQTGQKCRHHRVPRDDPLPVVTEHFSRIVEIRYLGRKYCGLYTTELNALEVQSSPDGHGASSAGLF
jgi:hypothetical protein